LTGNPTPSEHADGDVDLPLKGKMVTRCFIDTAFSLEIWEKGSRTVIRIGGTMSIEHRSVRLELNPKNPDKTDVARAAIL